MNPPTLEPGYRFYGPKPSRFWASLFRPLHLYALRRWYKVQQITIHGGERVLAALEQKSGLLIMANHPAHGDAPVLYESLRGLGMRPCFMAAWQVFRGLGGLKAWALQRMGVFSVDREGADLQAFRQAVEVLSEGQHPLVIFPEGEVYHLNDRLTPLREGAAMIALAAARRSLSGRNGLAEAGPLEDSNSRHEGRSQGLSRYARATRVADAPGPAGPRPTLCVPCAIKFYYLHDPTSAIEKVMEELERRIYWRPQSHRPLDERIYKFAEAVLALKEKEYMDTTGQGPLPERIAALMTFILADLEQAHFGQPQKGTVPVRVKELRRHCLELAGLETPPAPGTKEHELLTRLAKDFEDLYFVTQLFSYPGDYVAERPTVERMAETVQKFSEDALGITHALPTQPQHAVVAFGEPVDVTCWLAEQTSADLASRPIPLEDAPQPLAGQNRPRVRSRQLASKLTTLLEERMQALIDQVAHGAVSEVRSIAATGSDRLSATV